MLRTPVDGCICLELLKDDDELVTTPSESPLSSWGCLSDDGVATVMRYARNTAAAVLLAAFGLIVGSGKASACDELMGRLITNSLRPAVESLDCSVLRRAGINRRRHHIERVCYQSAGPTSRIELQVELRCSTSDNAVVRASVSESVTAEAEVRAADCAILRIEVRAAGALGRLLLDAFDANGRAREALREALERAC